MTITNIRIKNANLDLLRNTDYQETTAELEYKGVPAPCIVFEENSVIVAKAYSVSEYEELKDKDFNELLNEKITAKLIENAKYYQAMVEKALETYADFEIETFQIQKTEYYAYVADHTSKTPFINSIVSEDETKEELIIKIGKNITGVTTIQKAMRDKAKQIKACTTIEQLEAL